MATEIIVTDAFRDWFYGLSQPERGAVIRVVTLLEDEGVALEFPYSSAIQGAKIAMRELRIQYAGAPYRVLYAFDPIRRAVLLVGGVKTGKGNRWYEAAIHEAEKLWQSYLDDIRTDNRPKEKR